MPHFIIEYSANLDDRIDIAALCQCVHEAACDTGMFPLAGTRVRAIRCETYAVADLDPNNGFVHMILRLGQGRTLEAKQAAGAAIYSAMGEHLAVPLASGHFALSFEMAEIDGDLSWKTNSIHRRLQNKG